MDYYQYMKNIQAEYAYVQRLLNEPPNAEVSRRRLMDAGIIDANGQLTDNHTFLASESCRYWGMDHDDDGLM